ncbi:Flp pilus assembly protein [Bordetella ansorpii]|uniref:Flp pilus assembly protein n=1 Tax=Bordetella ansorpii TaxID=288768 RepID=A0A157SPW9_9BORD|nr:Flp pilus assembly protein [Bordetella ansorpii]
MVFMVFFLVVYGLLTYGFVFAAQQQLNYAAEEGARSALYWQGGRQLPLRASLAASNAGLQADWVGRMGGSPAVVTVCGPAGLLSGSGACSGVPLEADQIEVMVSYAYGSFPLVPLLPGMGVLVPDRLSSRASVRIGGQADQPAAS